MNREGGRGKYVREWREDDEDGGGRKEEQGDGDESHL